MARPGHHALSVGSPRLWEQAVRRYRAFEWKCRMALSPWMTTILAGLLLGPSVYLIVRLIGLGILYAKYRAGTDLMSENAWEKWVTMLTPLVAFILYVWPWRKKWPMGPRVVNIPAGHWGFTTYAGDWIPSLGWNSNWGKFEWVKAPLKGLSYILTPHLKPGKHILFLPGMSVSIMKTGTNFAIHNLKALSQGLTDGIAAIALSDGGDDGKGPDIFLKIIALDSREGLDRTQDGPLGIARQIHEYGEIMGGGLLAGMKIPELISAERRNELIKRHVENPALYDIYTTLDGDLVIPVPGTGYGVTAITIGTVGIKSKEIMEALGKPVIAAGEAEALKTMANAIGSVKGSSVDPVLTALQANGDLDKAIVFQPGLFGAETTERIAGDLGKAGMAVVAGLAATRGGHGGGHGGSGGKHNKKRGGKGGHDKGSHDTPHDGGHH